MGKLNPNRSKEEKPKGEDKINGRGNGTKLIETQREENKSVYKEEWSSGTCKNRDCSLDLELPSENNLTVFNRDRIILLRKMLEKHLAGSSYKYPPRFCQISKHSNQASNSNMVDADNRHEQRINRGESKVRCKEGNMDELCNEAGSDNDTIRRKVCGLSHFPDYSSDPGCKSYNGSGSLSSQTHIISSFRPESPITTLKSVKSKTKRNPKTNINKSSNNHRLNFVTLDEGHEKVRSHLKQNNWIQRTLSMTELNLNHLIFVQVSSPGANMWNKIEDDTLVSSFPRIFQHKSEGSHLEPCSEWVFTENTAPLTFIVKAREGYLNLMNFVNYHFTKACVNLLMFTMINGTNLLSNDGTVPLWILTFALDICQEEERRGKVEFDRNLTFLDYYDSLLHDNGMFKGNDDNGSVKFLISMVQKIKVQLANIAPDFVKQIENNGSFSELRQNHPGKNHTTSPNIYPIPTDTWVLKANPAKQYGVRRFKKVRGLLMEIDSNEYECDYYIIQKYVSDQYLINNLPFKIHVYVFLQSVEPLEILPFNRGVYVIMNTSTRPCVYECHKDLIFWTLEEFEAYLLSVKKGNAWTDNIWPQMMTAIIQTFTHNKQFLQQRRKSFELVCTSFILDTFLNPYLINIKSDTYRFDRLPHNNYMIQKIYKLIMNKL